MRHCQLSGRNSLLSPNDVHLYKVWMRLWAPNVMDGCLVVPACHNSFSLLLRIVILLDRHNDRAAKEVRLLHCDSLLSPQATTVGVCEVER